MGIDGPIPSEHCPGFRVVAGDVILMVLVDLHKVLRKYRYMYDLTFYNRVFHSMDSTRSWR